MRKRGKLVGVVVILLSLFVAFLGNSVSVSAGDGDPCWEITPDFSGCTYGTLDCAWWDPLCWTTGDCVGSTETCSPHLGFSGCLGTKYYNSVGCSNSGCTYDVPIDCSVINGCRGDNYNRYTCDASDPSKCSLASSSCINSCCPWGQTCQGSPATCQPPPVPCRDNDGDGYGNPGQSNCRLGSATDCNDGDASKWQLLSGYVDNDLDGYGAGSAVNVCSGMSLPSGYSSTNTDCNDANAAVYPGAAEVCGNGVDEDCSGGDLACGGCGDWIANGAEACDWGANNGVWTPSLVSCPGGYPDVSGQYRCKSDCSSFEYDTSNCGKCNDGVCNGPETKVTCAIDCDKCGNGGVDAGEVCDLGVFNGAWSADTVSCPGGYDDVLGRSRCKTDCSGFEYDTSNCGRCGDRRCENPETKFSCAIDCLWCGNNIWEAARGEACDWGPNNGGAWQFNSLVSCGAYPSVEKDYRCSLSCQYEYNTPSCGSCGDAVVNGPEQCETGQTQQYTCPDGSKVTQSCDSTTCQWLAASCPVPATCTDGVKNGDETGVDCGGSCVLAGVPESCDGVDNNKDCSVGWGEWDNDLDGLMACAGDCDDTDPLIQACPPPAACVGVELDSSQACCVGAGFQWVKSGEPNVGKDEVDNQFQDNEGKRKAPHAVRLLPNEHVCYGDDGANELFFARTKECKPGACADDPLDKVMCDKASDCVYTGRCYSDISLVASTFFGNDVSEVWKSSWKGEVSTDVTGDGKVEVCDPGMWGGAVGTVTGTVRNIAGQPVAGATVKVLGMGLSATTLADGTYSIVNVLSGTYDVFASKPADGYDDATALNVNAVSGAVTVDFTLLLSLGSCTNDCTKAGSNFCDASCDGKGLCKFYSSETKQACDGTFGIVGLSGGRQISCCEGQPYTPQKADVTVRAKEVVKIIKPVVYRGRLVKLVTLLFIPER